MKINQPSTQIKLTNVSYVRMRKAKKRFEIACYQNKVQDWRSGVEKDIDEVLQIPQVFLNVSKGLVAPTDDLKKAFGTTDHDKIILEILNKGELQLSEKERQQNTKNLTKSILLTISTKCINPKTKKPYTTSMISKTLEQLKFNVNPNKNAKTQALEAIRLLISKQIIPIARAKMRVKLSINQPPSSSSSSTVPTKQLSTTLKDMLDEVELDEWTNDSWECTAFIDPWKYRELTDIVGKASTGKNKVVCHLEVLDMSVVEEGDK